MDKQIRVIISAVDNATWWLKKIWNSISEFGKKNKETFADMRNWWALAFGAITASAWLALNAFAWAQAQMAKVDWILKTLWNDTVKKAWWSLDALRKSIDWVSQANIKLWFDDEDTATSIARLTAATWDYKKALDLNNLAMDLARYKWIWLAEASDTLIKVQAWQTRVLKELGIEVKEWTTAQEAFAIVQQKTAWQAQAFSKTVVWQTEAMKIAFANLQENIWQALAPAFTKLAETIQPLIQKFSDWATQNPELLANLLLIAWALTWMVTVIWAIWLALPWLIAWFTALWATLVAIWIWWWALLAIWAALLYLTSGWPSEAITTTTNDINALTASFKSWQISAEEYKSKMWELTVKMWELSAESQTSTWQIRDAFDLLIQDIADWIVKFANGINTAFENVKTWFAQLLETINWILDESVLAINNFIELVKKSFEDFQTRCSQLWEAFRQIFIDGWEWIKNGVLWIIDSFTSWVKTKLNWILEFAQSVIKTIVWFVNNAKELAWKIWWGISDWVQAVWNLITGKRAMWGTIRAWQSYLVGENWPEIINPATTSSVSQPWWNTMSVNINLWGVQITNAQDENRLVQMLKNAFIEEAKNFNLWVIV